MEGLAAIKAWEDEVIRGKKQGSASEMKSLMKKKSQRRKKSRRRKSQRRKKSRRKKKSRRRKKSQRRKKITKIAVAIQIVKYSAINAIHC